MSTVPSPNAIGAQLIEMDGQAQAIDVAMSGACQLDPPALLPQWKAFLAGYKTFSSKSRTTLGSTLFMVSSPYAYAASLSDISTSADSYQAQLNTWAGIADKQCGGNAGQTTTHTPVAVAAASVLTSATYLALAVGGLWLLVNYLPKRR